MIALRSSQIQSVSYAAGSLTVHFKNGGIYTYHSVPNDIFVNLVKSPSPGSFLNRSVKGRYKFTKHPPKL
jgi:hypothetical protein